ncbi:MAG: S1 RNA-binding domain-containing protein [Clostridia bacterium]|nr:S1 RNA-binding domain-containing protein [Clostridia bacterium]
MSLEVGKIVAGRVDGITNFGAFVSIGDGKTGLVHISEVASEYVKDIHDFLQEGQEVRVKIVSLEPNGKIALSIKQAVEEKPRTQAKKPAEFEWTPKRSSAPVSFEDKLLQFKHDSDERMQSIRRNTEVSSRRGFSRRGN